MQTPVSRDYAAVEATADLKSAPPHCGVLSRRERRLAEANKEFPPPLSWLARTESLLSHVPWVMRKYYTGDGRLIIKEERVKRHEYFLADRSNGRLVLNLVHVDDVSEESSTECEDEVEEENRIDAGDEGKDDFTVEEVPSECFKYNGGVGLMPCGGFVAAAAAAAVFRPPVQT